jgi:hypothetical protein
MAGALTYAAASAALQSMTAQMRWALTQRNPLAQYQNRGSQQQANCAQQAQGMLGAPAAPILGL